MDIKPGIRTTEFQAVIISSLAALGVLVWHQDFTVQIQSIVIAIAGIVNLTYVVVRAALKILAGAHLITEAAKAPVPAVLDAEPTSEPA